ncbi:MAG: hypothetical protein GXP55_20850 [Deltaproteobacteria bacterium]|nr:hypothetical protein [Deltaproteobacteria bacterium]
MRLAVFATSLAAMSTLVVACAAGNRNPTRDTGVTDTGAGDTGIGDGGMGDGDIADTAVPFDSRPPPRDVGPRDARLDPDAACASAVVAATVERLPVDIIWVVDNSVSMEPAITEVNAGLNNFAALIGASGIDYRVIMLALRGSGRITVGGRDRFGVCIPAPLAGDASCGDGPRFFQVEVDIRSTQPIEQILGTLGQTTGYLATDDRGSDPWLPLLRADATKTLVVVTDDNSRTCDLPRGSPCNAGDPPLTTSSLEDFPGGPNPFNSRELGPGLLSATYAPLFDGYTFNALYGWGSETDPSVTCTYPGGSRPPASGQTYTELVRRTGGVRAQICDGSAAWGPFFDAVATAVTRTSRIDCNVTIPPPPAGMTFDPALVNVIVRSSADATYLPKRVDASACDVMGGWYYDDPTAPTQVILCPTSCDAAQATLAEPDTGLDVQLGCASLLI